MSTFVSIFIYYSLFKPRHVRNKTNPIVCNVEQREKNVNPITREGGLSDSKSPHWRHWKLSCAAGRGWEGHRTQARETYLLCFRKQWISTPSPALKLIDDSLCSWLCSAFDISNFNSEMKEFSSHLSALDYWTPKNQDDLIDLCCIILFPFRSGVQLIESLITWEMRDEFRWGIWIPRHLINRNYEIRPK